MWGGDGEAELPYAQIWFRSASPGTLPQAEPPAALYKALRLDRRAGDLNPQLRSPAQDTGELPSHFPQLLPAFHCPVQLLLSSPASPLPLCPSTLKFSLFPHWSKVLPHLHLRSGTLRWSQ